MGRGKGNNLDLDSKHVLFNSRIGKVLSASEEASSIQFTSASLVESFLTKQIQKYTQRPSDKEKSKLMISFLMVQVYDENVDKVMKEKVIPFIENEDNRVFFKRMYSQYENDYRACELLHQPEAFLIFERIENDRHNLRAEWQKANLDINKLETMAAIFGIAI